MRIGLLALNAISTRTRLLARALNAKLYLLKSKPPYLDLASKIANIVNESIDTLIVQLPTGPLLLASILSKNLVKNVDVKVVADAHTGFLTTRFNLKFQKHFVLNYPFKLLLSYTDLILIHNETNYKLLPRRLYSKTLVLYDPFYVIESFFSKEKCGDLKLRGFLKKEEYAVYPASWHPDEPIEFLVEAWTSSGIPIPLVITGRPRQQILRKIGERLQTRKVVLSGYIENYGKYLCLLSRALFVVSATTSNFDMQCSAYEALALGKPIAASNRLAIRSVLRDAPVYFNYDKESLHKAVSSLLKNYDYVLDRTIMLAKSLEEKIERQIETLLDALKG